MPDILKYSDAFPDKSTSLEDAKKDKLDYLSNAVYEKATLESMYDTDSPRFVGVTGGVGGTTDEGVTYDRTDQLTADRVAGIDSYEVFPRSEETLLYQTTDPNGMAKMATQRARLAEARGVNVSDITNEDVYEEGAKGTIKELALLKAYSLGDADYIEKVKAWEPSKELTSYYRTNPTDFGSKENPLNIEVDRAILDGYGYYGRPLTSVRGVGSDQLLGEAAGYAYDFEGKKLKTPAPTAEEISAVRKQIDAENASFGDRLGNAAAGFGSSFVNELFVKPATAIGDLTGAWSIDESTQEDVNDFFGYNDANVQMAMEEVGKQWDIVADSNASTTERMKAAGRGIIEAFTTPEMLGTSFGALASWFTPGVILKGVGVGSKFAQTASKIDAAVKAGQISAAAGKAQKAKALMSIDGAKAALASQSGFMVTALGNVNEQYKEFVENNNGVELEGEEKAKWFAGRFAVQVLNQNLDKLVDVNILKNPGMIASVVPAVKAMTNKEFANVAKAMGKGILKTTENMGKEAAQEYTQSMMELFNSRYGSEKFSNAEDFAAFVTDERNTREAGIGALAGAGGAPQFEVAGAILPTAMGGAKLTARGVSALTTVRPTAKEDAEPESEEVKADVAKVFENLGTVATEGTGNAATTYYAAQGSASTEIVAKAKEEAARTKEEILNGTSPVFKSDADLGIILDDNLGPAIEVIVAEEPNLTVQEILDALVANLKPTTQEETAQITEAVQKAHTNGTAFAAIKTMDDVAKEVTDGGKGFKTYFANAMAALSLGDGQGYEASKERLYYFYDYQRTKLDNVKEGIRRVREDIEAAVDIAVKQNPSLTRGEALDIVSQNYENKKPYVVKNSSKNDKTTKVSYKDVANSLKNKNYAYGIFGLVNTIGNEVEAMAKALNALDGKVESTTSTETTSNAGQTTTESTLAPEQVQDLKQRAVKAVGKQGSANAKNVQDQKQIIETNLGEEAASIFEAEATRVAEQNFADYQARKATEAAPAAVEDLPEGANFDEEVDQVIDQGTDEVIEPEAPSSVESPLPEGMGAPTAVDFDEAQFDASVEEEFEVDQADLDAYDTFVEAETETEAPTKGRVKADKDQDVKDFIAIKDSIKELTKQITARREVLRKQGIRKKEDLLKDEELTSLLSKRQMLKESVDNLFTNVLKTVMSSRVVQLGKDKTFRLYKKYLNTPEAVAEAKAAYKNKKGPKVESTRSGKFFTAIRKPLAMFEELKPTGFTLRTRNANQVKGHTKTFAEKLTSIIPFNATGFDSVSTNPLSIFLYDDQGKVNYNAVEAIQAAVYQFVQQEASNLLGTNRTTSEVAEVFGITEEQVTPEMYNIFASGGITLKLAANSVGSNVITNLGLSISSVQDKEALATAFGIAGLKAIDDFVDVNSFTDTTGVAKLYGSIDYVKGTPVLFEKAKFAGKALQVFGDELGVDLSKERTYRETPTSGRRKVNIHNAEYLEAPKDHQAVVNRLENMAMGFNDGVTPLAEAFTKEDGTLDADALVERIIGPKSKATNKDARDRYEAQEFALRRSINFFEAALKDVEDKEIFFNYFIARNQRIHLDSNTINPQNDKHLARWLLTSISSRISISKKDIQGVLNGEETSMEAMMFVYSIVQAFDGADGAPGIDKDPHDVIVAYAKKILEDTSDEDLVKLVKNPKVGHVGHAALAVANIRKYMDADGDFESSMVLEVDGLTNGFAFRAMQFPVQSPDSKFTPAQWLEKVGVIADTSTSGMQNVESMNEARSAGQEDVYISVGSELQDNIIANKEEITGRSATWIELLESIGGLGLPNFANKEDPSTKKFIRNLMKSPVMIFNYAAGKKRIAKGLVQDQIMGTNYLSGRGIIDALTLKDKGEYVVSKELLESMFNKGKNDLGTRYHNARVALENDYLDSKKNEDIMLLKAHLYNAIGQLYIKPLEETLEGLFGIQTVVNQSLVEAAQFMFVHFKEQYSLWRAANPNASEKQKTEFLKDMVDLIPGVAGAASDDYRNKVGMLQSILESTDEDVEVNIQGQRYSANTISRSFGDPGVGPAVLVILSLDSTVMAKSINAAFKGTDTAVLPVHDAKVLGPGEYQTITQYNEDFYTTNRNYSITKEFANAIEKMAATIPGTEHMTIDNKGPDKEERPVIFFQEMKEALNTINSLVQQGRKDLFDKNVKVGQLVGPKGLMAEINVKDELEAAKADIAGYAGNILGQFNSKSIKSALGKDFKQAYNKLNEMLKGCK